jgi:catechol 2,3-dioxygenase-like lactoylglutathione lyase family enzyme
MNVKGLAWLGTKTDRFEETARFYEEVMGFRPVTREPGFAVYRLPNGDTVELFGSSGYDYFNSGPVAGFAVDDVEETRGEMEARGIEFWPQRRPAPAICGPTSAPRTAMSTS